jgi:hypothetical protein
MAAPASTLFLRDRWGRYWGLGDAGDFRFAPDRQALELAGAGEGAAVLRHAASGLALALADGRPCAARAGAPLAYFVDMDGGAALRFPSGAFLSSDRASGAPRAGRLGRERLYFEEATAPPCARLAWPMRCTLADARTGVHLSEAGGKLAAAAEAACCAEEFLLDLPGAAAAGAPLEASLWSADAARLASVDVDDGQVLFRDQHGCMGAETFCLHIHAGNEVSLTCAAPPGDDEGAAAALVQAPPGARCLAGAKPSRHELRLAGGHDALLVTAHGALVGACAATGRPRAAPLARGGDERAAAHAAAWRLEHHGGCVYSLRHAASGGQLLMDAAGAPRVRDPAAERLAFPDARGLFRLELAVAEAAGAGGAAARAVGFAVLSLARFGGRQLMLSALPDGRLAAVRAAPPSRWELFAVADAEAVLGSSLRPLLRLPCAGGASAPAPPAPAPAPAAPAAIRRSSSMQALPPVAASPPAAASPLSRIAEGAPFHGAEAAAAECAAGGGLRRRCASEPALADLHRRAPPPSLAGLRAPERRAAGWGVRSAAPLAEQACRRLVGLVRAAAAAPPDAPGSAAAELRERVCAHVPRELAARITAEADLLAAPPPRTKLSWVAARKAGEHAPLWAVPALAAAAALPAEEFTEAALCACCEARSGWLLPMDPELNPRHHEYLRHQERLAFGRRPRRRRGGGGAGVDPVTAGLRVAKHGVLLWAAVRCVAVFLA